MHLKPDKSARPDGMHPQLMKGCASEISFITFGANLLEIFTVRQTERSWQLQTSLIDLRAVQGNEISCHKSYGQILH